ncbi:MAG TPA: hypothetical protein PLZ08_02675 [Bacillota bacterium]|jgi:hypothetical protein|nr:hypothetical protein [Bacillota bacterium]HOL09168.1 hypothetical protein [Bacillota bacterium]HPO96843.1 hypothetical protein [Bacillota bacterium]
MSAVNKTLDYIEVRFKENKRNILSTLRSNFENKNEIVEKLREQNEFYAEFLNKLSKENGLPVIDTEQLTHMNADKMISKTVENLKNKDIPKGEFFKALEDFKNPDNQLNVITIEGLRNKFNEYEQKGVRFLGNSGKEKS